MYNSENKKNMSTRKNNTNAVVTWPTKQIFSLKDIFDQNVDQKEITLRNKLVKAIENKKFAEIGTMANPVGRPSKMFAAMPITKTILDMAESMNITLVDSAMDKFVKVVNISANMTTQVNPVTPSVAVK